MRYTLTATLEGVSRVQTFYEADDFEATLEGIKRVLDAACADKLGPWAIGEVVLAEGARVVHVMPAKVSA